MATLRNADSPRLSPGGPVVIRVPLTPEQTTLVAHLTGSFVTALELTREQLKSLVDIVAFGETVGGR